MYHINKEMLLTEISLYSDNFNKRNKFFKFNVRIWKRNI